MRYAEQGTEGVERIEPPVEAEGEFVEVGLQVLVTDPVMDAVQPRFQVCEDEMDDWQILLGDLRIAPFSDGEVFVAALGKAGVAAPVVGDERRARHNGALNEAAERLRAAVRHDGEPNPPGIATTLPLVELGARLALANLHSAGDKNLIVDATAFAARPAASPGFIDFDVLAGPAADPVLIRAHHPRAELVEDLERRLVARQAKLSPKLHGRHAGCLAGHQIGRPKPYAQRRVRARHDRSHRQSGVTAALAAAQDARTICEAERLSRRLTMGANKPVAPASLLQVGGAGRVVGKKSLELWERLWEPKIATLVNVHEHGRTLPLVAVGDNRIGKVDPTKPALISAGQTYLKHIPSDRIGRVVEHGFLAATSDFDRLCEPDGILICVPTPLTRHMEPDLTYVEATAQCIAKRLRSGQLVILESTTYPGTTRQVVRPILEATGLSAGKDFWLAFSPEREDPGNIDHSTATIPKVVPADDPQSRALAIAIYRRFAKEIVQVSSSATAEAVKLTENIFRAVNIALVNEHKLIYDAMGINIWEVIDAAKTKPFGFMAFYPGPGLGGHCIPIDPFYLTWKAKEYNVTTRFIELAGQID